MPDLRSTNILLLAVLIIGLGYPKTTIAQLAAAYPVDEASKDPSFFTFRYNFIRMVINRDVEGIIAMSCPHIKLSFGGGWGHDDLRQALTGPEETLDGEDKAYAARRHEEYWSNLQKTLLLGGRFNDVGDFWAPYTWKADVPNSYDPFATYFVMGAQVLVRDKPSKDGTAIDSLNYNIVTAPQFDGGDGEYLPIEMANGKTGFVHRDYLRSQLDYRAQFVKDDQGQWKMCMFLAGD